MYGSSSVPNIFKYTATVGLTALTPLCYEALPYDRKVILMWHTILS